MKTWFVLTASVLLATAGSASLSLDAPAYHIEITPARHVEAILTDTWETPKITPRQWAMFAAFPPTLPCQDQIKAQFSIDQFRSTQGVAAELSPLHRPILWVKVPTPKGTSPTEITARVVYEATLYSRKLMPGAPWVPVLPLPSSERSLNLRTSKTIDWQTPEFQHWLDTNYLHRQPSERDLDYAFRVYQTIRSLYRYHYDPEQDRRASQICQAHQTDCGGFTYLIVAALRANNIPAHALAGRIAHSATLAVNHAECHVKNGVFRRRYWLGSGGRICWRWLTDKDAQINFGNDLGDLVVMHNDTDLELDPKPFEPVSAYVLQSMLHWVWGTGSFDGSKDTVGWQVKDLPMPSVQVGQLMR